LGESRERIVITVEGEEGAELHPAGAELVIGVAIEAAADV
jgi:hypothetical protein